MNKDDKIITYLKVATWLILLFALLGTIIYWQYHVSYLNKKQEKDVSTVIQSVVREQSQRDLLLPKIVFINVDSVNRNALSDSLSAKVVQILTKKYLADDFNVTSTDFDLKPFYVLPGKADKKGNYVLTENQLADLRGYLEFLGKKVESEVDKSKEEISRDIDRLNLWVSIWIGVIGFLGIFIPIIINVDTSKSAELATIKSDEAFDKSEKAIGLIESKKESIAKIEGIETRVGKAEKDIGAVMGQVGEVGRLALEARDNATTAKTKSDALHLVYNIDRLNNLEPENIKYVKRESWVSLFRETLLLIKQSLEECKVQHDGQIVKESLSKLVIRLTRISFQKFLQIENTESISNYLLFVTDTVTNNYNQETFHQVVVGLETLANNLKEEE